MLFVLGIVYLCICTSHGLIEPISLPSALEDCINYKVDLNKGSGTPLHTIQNLCLSKFAITETPHNWKTNLTAEEERYIQSLLHKVFSEAEQSPNLQHRSRRSIPVQKRYRREIRSAGHQYWDDYAKAVRRLKFKEIGPNGRSRYDTIADIHMTAINSAHFGPNFLSWHRLFLLIFETALGVPIPYWDSSIDYELDDPTESILWTDRYFGNGFGRVKTGPFANFETPSGPLIRNIGSDGSLFNKRSLNQILSRSQLKHILEPTAEERVSLEGQHNSIHNWVDGQMNTQEFSPHDPLFWTHHCFVDYIWEKFRYTQRQRGIDPVIDIPEPPENVTFQGANDPSVGLFGFYNRDGYSERIANLVKYEPHPECPRCGDGVDLTCHVGRGVCISKVRNPTEYAGDRVEATEIANRLAEQVNGRRRGNVFDEYMRDDRVRGDSLTIQKKKQHSKYSLAVGDYVKDDSYGSIPLFANDRGIYDGPERSHNLVDRNSFIHVGDLNNLASQGNKNIGNSPPSNQYIPQVKVSFRPTYFRPIVYPYFVPQLKNSQSKFTPFPQYMRDIRTRDDSITMNKYFWHSRGRRSLKETNIQSRTTDWKPNMENTYFLDGQVNFQKWAFIPVKILFNDNNNTNSIQSLEPGSNKQLQADLGINDMCRPHELDNKIHLQANGLNYFGKYKDYSLLIGNSPITTYIGVKKPSNDSSEVFLSAYDSCGKVCSPRCVVPGIYPTIYKSCTGAVRASAKEPLMYMDVSEENLHMPLPSENEIPVIFVCDIV